MNIQQALKKSEHYDADERFMATRDLIANLDSKPVLDESTRSRIKEVVLRLLDDGNGDVVTMATKALGAIVQVFPSSECATIAERLGKLIVDPSKGSSRDTWADGLKQLITSLREEDGSTVAASLVSSLLKGLKTAAADDGKNSEEMDINLEMVCLDVLRHLLVRFGEDMQKSHAGIVEQLEQLLEHSHPDLRKRSNQTLGSLVGSLSENHFQKMTAKMISIIKSRQIEDPVLHTYIQTVGVVSTHAGVRLGKHLDDIIPSLLNFCRHDVTDDSTDVPEAIIELWENCLQAFEAIIYRCPKEATPFLDAIVKEVAMRFIKFDPLVGDPTDTAAADGGTADMEEDDDDDWGDDDDDDWGDGGGEAKGWGNVGNDVNMEENAGADSSWKIRRGAVSVLSAFIRARSDVLRDYYETLVQNIVGRFSERDSTVKEHVLLCCRDLLQQAVVADKTLDNRQSSSLSIPTISRQRSTYQTLDDNVELIVRACHEEFPKAKIANQKAVMAVLRELLIVKHVSGSLAQYLHMIVPHALAGLKSSDNNAKSDAFKLIHLVLEFHRADDLKNFAGDIAASVSAAVQSESHPTTKADGLSVLGTLAGRLPTPEFLDAAAKVFSIVATQLSVKDTSQTIKDASAIAVSKIIAAYGKESFVTEALPKVLTVFKTRLGNESSRVAVLQGLTLIANSPVHVSLEPIITDESITLICSFFRKMQKEVRDATGVCLRSLVRSNSAEFSQSALKTIIGESQQHVSESDLHLSSLVLDLMSTTIELAPKTASEITKTGVLDTVLAFTTLPVVEGRALESLKLFYKALCRSKNAKLKYDSLVKALVSSINEETDRRGRRSIAECIAALTLDLSDGDIAKHVDRFASEVESKSSLDHTREVALYVIGEIGREKDLSSHNGLDATVFSAFSQKSDSVQVAASYALGNIAVGNMAKFLPGVLQLIQERDAERYLLFLSLKEIILHHAIDDDKILSFYDHVPSIMPLLMAHSESKEEGPRVMVAECLGRIAAIDDNIVKTIVELSKSANPLGRAVAVIAARYAVASESVQPGSLDAFREHLPAIFDLLADSDLSVRHQTVHTIQAVARAHASLVEGQLKDSILPKLYAETAVRPELIETKDYGGFIDTIDHGLPMRQTVFQCLLTLVEFAPHKVDKSVFLDSISKGFSESNNSIVMESYQILHYMADNHQNDLLEVLNQLASPMFQGVKARMSDLSSKNARTAELATEVLTTAVRTIFRVMKIPEVEQCESFIKFHNVVVQSVKLKGIVDEVRGTKKQPEEEDEDSDEKKSD